ncbi:MAG: Rid family hydrolase, partial [Solirubrobacteraceae bacterium]
MTDRLPGDPPSPYELRYGFSRVIRAGGFVLIGGTTSVTPDGVVLGETPYEQTVEILGKLLHELGRAGCGPADVIQTRLYVTDITRADEVGRAHGEVFAAHRPLMTMV